MATQTDEQRQAEQYLRASLGLNQTEEQKAAYAAALESERAGYVSRIAKLKAGKQDPLGEDELAARVKQVDAELARAGGPKRGRGKKAADAEPADDAGDGGADGEG